jgi:hypothetical protein
MMKKIIAASLLMAGLNVSAVETDDGISNEVLIQKLQAMKNKNALILAEKRQELLDAELAQRKVGSATKSSNSSNSFGSMPWNNSGDSSMPWENMNFNTDSMPWNSGSNGDSNMPWNSFFNK